MKNNIIYFGIFCIITIIGASSFVAYAAPVIDDSKKPSYLIVLSATSGKVEGDTLTLNGVPSAVYFTDRPQRKAGHLSIEKFIETWNRGSDNFKIIPPNATLSVLKEDGAKNVVVELKSVEQKGGLLVFKVALLEGNIKGKFGTCSLFIDARLDGLILN